ncbi:alpha/beta hydrolase family esterase [Flagellimonas nanhaiensis]|uniref:Phospholipase/carboxylesterase/thioesterase domain-containing protein n=1 Tax=Flagellimonas nanhaiensis TaxID=2292706 RepID=A0A371JN31_9FLAO|nr:hypothetical protein [Allomuricauda nanhaiensis]RDY58649.1 hypothetical protein DX873_13250 [Allomuricauda nanhaiensis]
MKKILSKLTLIISGLFLICLTPCRSQKIQDIVSDSINMDGIQRGFTYYEPPLIRSNPDFIMVLHGATMSVDLMRAVTGNGFEKIAKENKDAIVIYPSGFDNFWNDCRKEATYTTKLENMDDIGFFEAIVQKLSIKYNIKENKVFVVGFSNGGHMVYKLAKVRPDRFNGFAVVGANLPTQDNDDCNLGNTPVSMFIANGTSDPINPYFGGEVKAKDGISRGKVLSTEQTLNHWLDLNQGSKIVSEELLHVNDKVEEDNSLAVIYSYVFENRKKISLVKIVNGGHHFNNPGFSDWPNYLGNLNRDVNLPESIMDFFKNLRK